MANELIQQLRAWNPWWQNGKEGINRYEIPQFKREVYSSVVDRFKKGKQIVSIVGMRQIGKSTIMRQIIKELLQEEVDPKSIFYVSFDDPFLEAEMLFEKEEKLFDHVIRTYAEHVLGQNIENIQQPLYFFFDEIHQLPGWDKKLKAFYDRAYPVHYMVSGSSSLRLQKHNRESLIGRITEFTLWPFSFREFLKFKTSNNERIQNILESAIEQQSLQKPSFNSIIGQLNTLYQEANIWEKEVIVGYLKEYILVGGFPRAWEPNLDFSSRQRVLWEQHIVKVLYEDVVQVANIRKPKELAYLFMQIVHWNGKEFQRSELQERLGIHWNTLEKYLNHLNETFLIFRVDKTKSKRLEMKRKSGHTKFYVSDIAFRNAFYKYDETIFEDENEMGIIAENLVCSLVQRWISVPYKEDLIQFYRDNTGEVDFIVKQPTGVMPIEVKYRSTIKKQKTMEKICKKWELQESLLITKENDLSFHNDQLSMPLWFFLIMF
ncbi:ATP-binding protein [Candidatus Peregrinibacteria bacterium]|nr:ATP-binding protein [Candidatus Peregrinibacteria bacterium]